MRGLTTFAAAAGIAGVLTMTSTASMAQVGVQIGPFGFGVGPDYGYNDNGYYDQGYYPGAYPGYYPYYGHSHYGERYEHHRHYRGRE